ISILSLHDALPIFDRGTMVVGEAFAELFGEDDAAVAAAGAADRDGEIALSFRAILRNQESEHRFEAREEFLCLRSLEDPLRHARIGSGMRLEALDEIGIRQEANVEDQVARRRNPVAETKGQQRYVERVLLPRPAEPR